MLKGVTPPLGCCYEVNMCLHSIWILNPFLLSPLSPKPLTWGSGWDTVLLVMYWASLGTAVLWAVWEHPDLDAAELPCSAGGLLPHPTCLNKIGLYSYHNVRACSDWADILVGAASSWLYCATGNENKWSAHLLHTSIYCRIYMQVIQLSSKLWSLGCT